MTETLYINRTRFEDEPTSFHNLRKQGIAYAQQYASGNWTDFNAHDPGVTILEQLCYALTELNYYADFEVKDLLASPQGQLNFKALGLSEPAQILPSRVCSTNDYQQLLLDSVVELDRVTVRHDESGYVGTYVINVQLTESMRARCKARPLLADKLIDKISHVYSRHRNFCEDVAQINIIDDPGYELIAAIEIEQTADAERILANIYDEAKRWLEGSLTVETYQEQQLNGKSLADIFNGPLLNHGNFIVEQATGRQCGTLSSLYSQLHKVDGVQSISHLELVDIGAESISSTSSSSRCPSSIVTSNTIRASGWLKTPVYQEQVKVVVSSQKQQLAINYELFFGLLEQRQLRQNALRHTDQDMYSLQPNIKAQYRNLDQYQSVQQLFPAAYNLASKNQGATGSLEQKAKTRQLKGYLLIFDHLIANLNANIAGIPALFSVDLQQPNSYQYHHFTDKDLHDIELFYPNEAANKLDAIRNHFDDFPERKKRQLDYLIALYGEQSNESILRRYNPYFDEIELNEQVLLQQVKLLKGITTYTRDRCGGFDYRSYREFEGNLGGFHAKICYALALAEKQWPYSGEIKRQGLAVVSNHKYFELQSPYHNQILFDDAMAKQVLAVPNLGKIAVDPQRSAKLVKSLQPFLQGVIGESFFSLGTCLSHYKVVKRKGETNAELFFVPPGYDKSSQGQIIEAPRATSNVNLGDLPIFIGSCSNEDKAFRIANLVVQYLARLNRHCEGVYVVEHILLRPNDINVKADNVNQLTDSFSLQASVIMPGYSAKGTDESYRYTAQNRIKALAPAHVCLNFYWLDFERSCLFEQAYMQWLESRRVSQSTSEMCQKLAQEVLTLLAQFEAERVETCTPMQKAGL